MLIVKYTFRYYIEPSWTQWNIKLMQNAFSQVDKLQKDKKGN